MTGTKIKSSKATILYLMLLILSACVEPFEATSITFESALVIDATITNEVKQQQILLSRTYKLEDDGPKPVSRASVIVEDQQGSQYEFRETTPGIYVSETVFAAQAGHSYTLKVKTSDGREYASTGTELTPEAQIDGIDAKRLINNNGQEGVAIQVSASSNSGNARNYRYTYEETYKIIAPKWVPQDLKIPDPPPGEAEAPGCNLEIVPRGEDVRTCYSTNSSNNIVLTDTNEFSEDKVDAFTVRFINRDNYIISHRYSILVHQYVQSAAAYTFFETLAQFSGPESLFSETQPGYLAGNVFSVSDSNEKVLGYFDVASVTERRIYFNYDDLFPGEPLPSYIDPCHVGAPPLAGPAGCILRPIVANNLIRYYGNNEPPPLGEGPYQVVPRVCGDCTVLGGIEPPDFWTED